MWKMRSVLCLLLLLCCSAAFVAAQRSSNVTSKWKTLSGDAPKVIARGGFSGLVPDSSYNAYALASAISLADWIAWCDVQLTKDGVGICFPDIKLNNASDIDTFFKNKEKTYLVNGVSQKGWFSVDFNIKDLNPVSLKQGVYSRSPRFDGTPQQILTVQDVATQVKPPGFWLNIQHDSFYSQRNLSMRSFVLSLPRSGVIINYISSPEVNFLQNIASRLNANVTKRVFRFLGEDDIEPSTNQTYGSLVKNLTFIKTFASGILVPKHYIWPVDNSLYLQPHTSIVLDSHKEGLEIFAGDFFNDVPFAYNYSYDPVAECLSFIDNREFSVDGVLSDFPMTSSASIDCFSHLGKNNKPQVKLQIISPEGASGDYPGCTNLAYSKAASDGADVLGCPVQMTKDKIPFCLGSINLVDKTTAAQSPFTSIARDIPDLHITNGILTINLTWSDIQKLKPVISNPYSEYRLYRNPKARNDGNFMSLADFLTFAKNATSVSGVMINIENAAYLAKQGFGVTGAVMATLSKAGYSNQTAKKVMIQSNDSSVLEEFKKSSYELVYLVDDAIGDIENSTLLEIKTFAKSVVITKESVFPSEDAYLIGQTNVVAKLQSANLPVYVRFFNNEFVSQAWDFFSDSSAELNNHVLGAGINGVITDYPGTAVRYRRNRCLGFKVLPPYISPVQPGSLLGLMVPQFMPPAEAPNPVLTERDVTEPPLPPVAKISPASDNGSTAAGPNPPPNGQSSLVASILMSSVAILLAMIVVS